MSNKSDTDPVRYDDETVREYIEAERGAEPGRRLPTPEADHIEEGADGHTWRVHDPAADSFDVDQSAPLETPTAREAALEIAEAASVTDRGRAPHHTEVRDEDDSTDEALQDEVMTESELIDQGS